MERIFPRFILRQIRQVRMNLKISSDRVFSKWPCANSWSRILRSCHCTGHLSACSAVRKLTATFVGELHTPADDRHGTTGASLRLELCEAGHHWRAGRTRYSTLCER